MPPWATAAWLGLVSGSFVAGFIAAGRSLGLPLGVGQQVLWMAPLINALYFLLLSRCRRGVLVFLALATVTCDLSFSRVLSHYGFPHLHEAAWLLLSCGVAIQIADWPWPSIARWTMAPMLGAVAVLAVAMNTTGEHRRPLPPTPPAMFFSS